MYTLINRYKLDPDLKIATKWLSQVARATIMNSTLTAYPIYLCTTPFFFFFFQDHTSALISRKCVVSLWCGVGVIVVVSGSKVVGFAARTGESKWILTMSTER